MKKLLFVLSLLCLLMGGVILGVKDHQEYTAGLLTVIGEFPLTAYNQDRYQDNLIVYTEEYARNEYGFELLVESNSNCVLEADILVSQQPNTYIVSGHGEAADFLKTASIGDIVVIDGDTIILQQDAKQSNLKNLQLLNQSLDEQIAQKQERLYGMDTEAIQTIDGQLKKALLAFQWNFLLQQPDPEEIQQQVDEILHLIDLKYYASLESKTVEGRGMWHRPNASRIRENSLEGVKAFAQSLYDLGINTLYVETFWHGMTTYYSPYLQMQHPRMAKYSYGEYGNDYTLALLEECHKLGIEVHAWVELLNLKNPFRADISYVQPEWLYTDLDGAVSGYADPSSDSYQAFLENVLTEMTQLYPFDGISYDYIRYAETTTYGSYIDCGFTDNSIEKFKQAYGYLGECLQEDLKTNLTLREQWHAFKQAQITSLVKRMSTSLRATNPDLILSASPYGFIDQAKEIYMQDIERWVKNGYLDVVRPMIYTESVDLLAATAQSFAPYQKDVLHYTGISPLYNGATLRRHQELTSAVQNLQTQGVSFFASQNYFSWKNSQEICQAISTSTHRGRAVSPTDDVNTILPAWKKDVENAYTERYQPHMTLKEKELLQAFLLENTPKMTTLKEMETLRLHLKEFSEEISHFTNQHVRNRLTEKFTYVDTLLHLAISRRMISRGYWNPETTPIRPDPLTLSI
ncbi:MAG: family 10 glycosylhydrolase [Clostridia bacterium]|nr:family 10 glycosylhydrolase [Clostridia bacterium]